MRWFGKRKQNDIWDNDLEEPIGDLAAARRIRKICEAAADIATNMRSHPSRRDVSIVLAQAPTNRLLIGVGSRRRSGS
jgi:hypothetical protein